MTKYKTPVGLSHSVVVGPSTAPVTSGTTLQTLTEVAFPQEPRTSDLGHLEVVHTQGKSGIRTKKKEYSLWKLSQELEGSDVWCSGPDPETVPRRQDVRRDSRRAGDRRVTVPRRSRLSPPLTAIVGRE